MFAIASRSSLSIIELSFDREAKEVEEEEKKRKDV
jgi:hypothetical protein